MTRGTKLILAGTGITVVVSFLHYAWSQDAEPFYGPPVVADMILFVTGGCLLIMAAVGLAGWAVYRAAARRSHWSILLVLAPLVLGMSFSYSAIAEYSGDVLTKHQQMRQALDEIPRKWTVGSGVK